MRFLSVIYKPKPYAYTRYTRCNKSKNKEIFGPRGAWGPVPPLRLYGRHARATHRTRERPERPDAGTTADATDATERPTP